MDEKKPKKSSKKKEEAGLEPTATDAEAELPVTSPEAEPHMTSDSFLEFLSSDARFTQEAMGAELFRELALLKEKVEAHSRQIAELQARRHSPAHNAKVQVRDKETGAIYPSKNNAYRSLLKAGDLRDLVEQGVFGPEPEKNNFGWFALRRAMPDRFEEVEG